LALLFLPVSRLGLITPLGTADAMSSVGDDVELIAQPGLRLIFSHEALEQAPGKSVHPLAALAPSLEDADRAPTNLFTSSHRIKLQRPLLLPRLLAQALGAGRAVELFGADSRSHRRLGAALITTKELPASKGSLLSLIHLLAEPDHLHPHGVL
jgi:hypothetical protein